MVELRTLTALQQGDLKRIMPGYTSDEKYEVTQHVAADDTVVDFLLQRVSLAEPYVKRWDYSRTEYDNCIEAGLSLGAFDGALMIGIAIAEVHAWNKTMWLWEFGVGDHYRRQGVGMRMMAALVARAQSQRLRVIVAETQNTNVPAIRFYRKAGFEFDGIDLSYYSNRDRIDGEVALFMKRKLYE